MKLTIEGDVTIRERYKISNKDGNDVRIGAEWSKEFTFLAHPFQTKESDQIRYYVYSAIKPERDRILIEGDPALDIVQSEGWTLEFEFWAFTKKKLQAEEYTVLSRIKPDQSQVVQGTSDSLSGWEVYATFWTYSKLGQYRKMKCKIISLL